MKKLFRPIRTRVMRKLKGIKLATMDGTGFGKEECEKNTLLMLAAIFKTGLTKIYVKTASP